MLRASRILVFATLLSLFCSLRLVSAASKLKVLIVDGQNNHAWQQTTPVLKKILEDSGRFQVDVVTSPPHGADMSAFKPEFAAYDVVVLNYNGDPWPPATQTTFESFVRHGGGFVSYHAADNAFPDWKAYNQMIGVGGWGERTTGKSGSSLRFVDGKVTLNSAPSSCGHHGVRLPFEVTTRDPKNPIVKGLPLVWMHTADELYDTLCGPVLHVDVLATAYSDPANYGTGQNEPMLMTIRYGKGRVFHITLGHDVAAMQGIGFRTVFSRGTEWAATGKVKRKMPKNLPHVFSGISAR